MTQAHRPHRLLLEVLAIVALAELGVMLLMPRLFSGLSALQEGMLDIALLLLLATPAVVWRFMVASGGSDTPGNPPRMGFGRSRSATVLAISTQLLGLALTAGGVWWQSHNLQARAQEAFASAAERTEAAVVQSLERTLYGLKGARGAMAADPAMGRKDFKAYVDSRDLAQEFPGIRGFGFIRRVPRADLGSYEAAQRADGAPRFAVKTGGNLPDLLVIETIEPLAPNQAAWGLDVGQEPLRRAALQAAIARGEPTLLAGIELVQDAQKSPGFLYFLPVYKPGTQAQTAEERLRDLHGVVYAPIVAREMLSTVVNAAQGLVEFELFDGHSPSAQTMVFDADGALSVPPVGSSGMAPPTFQKDRFLQLGNRAMTLRLASTSVFDAAQDRSSLVLMGVGGAALSLLLTMAVWLLAAGRQRAQEMAEAMTDELRQMAQVVENTDNAVTLLDRNFRITWVNAGFSRITGYSAQDALGKTPKELFANPQADTAAVQALQDAAARGESCRVSLVNRARDGRLYWSDTEIQPTFNHLGEVTGFMEIGTDVSAQKQLQEKLEGALRDSSALLSTIQTHAIVSVTDRHGQILEVNDAFCQISGYSRQELLGQNHRIIKSQAQDGAFWSDFWHTISSGKPWRGEICNRAKDGSLYWVDSMIAPYVDSNGLVEKYISVRTDITARRMAQEQLRHSEAIFAGSFESAASGMAFVSPQGQWLRANPALCDYLGYSEAELQTLALHDVTHPDEWEADALQTEQLLEGERTVNHRTKRYLHRDGHVLWGLTSESCVFDADGTPQFLIAQIVDISARKRAEEALNLSNGILEESQAIAKVGGWQFDVDSGAVYWTLQTYRIYETTPDDFSPTLDNALSVYTSESQTRLLAAIGAAMEHGTGYDLELEIHTMLGNHRHVRATGSPTLQQGRVVRLSGIIQDITDDKERQRALQDALQRAEQATVSKGQFLANMSHEIRTPMNSIIGMTRMVLDADLPPLQRDYLQKAHKSANALLRILNDILDFSKGSAGQLQLEALPFDLADSLSNVAHVFELSLQRKGLALDVRVADAVPKRFVGDAMRLDQVLINLVGNAIKFTEQGGIALSVELLQATAQVAELQFTVADTGIGMDAAQLERLFTPFTQADSSITRKFGGTGLGLSITKQLVEMMGGSVSAHSTPGNGSQFVFTVQLALDTARTGHAEQASPGGALAATSPAGLAAPSASLLANPLATSLGTSLAPVPGPAPYAASPGASAAPPTDWAAARTVLQELQPLLAGRNLRARKVAESLSTLVAGSAEAGAVQHLVERVRELDFDAALGALENLQNQGIFPANHSDTP